MFENAVKIQVKIEIEDQCWDWCNKNITGWTMSFNDVDYIATYYFVNADDATAFKLKFG